MFYSCPSAVLNRVLSPLAALLIEKALQVERPSFVEDGLAQVASAARRQQRGAWINLARKQEGAERYSAAAASAADANVPLSADGWMGLWVLLAAASEICQHEFRLAPGRDLESPPEAAGEVSPLVALERIITSRLRPKRAAALATPLGAMPVVSTDRERMRAWAPESFV